MPITRAVIVVCDENQVNSNSFFDACTLALAASEFVVVIGLVPENVRQKVKTRGLLDESNFEFLSPNAKGGSKNSVTLFSQLDQFSLEANLLIVSIGNSAELNLYISSRLKSEIKRILQWHVVSSNYARYALLDQQRSLSAYIPKDTGVWVRDLIKKYGRREILSSLEGIRSVKTLVIGETIFD